MRALRLVDDTDRTRAQAAAALPSPLTTLPSDVAAAFGFASTAVEVVTRAEAMSVPAVRRGRAIICGNLGSMPLVARRGGEVVDRPWGDQPDTHVTRAHVLTWTVDDLLFSGRSWWRHLDRDAQGYPSVSERIEPSRVGFVMQRGGTALVLVDGEPVDDRDLCRFDGPDEGLLSNGGRALRTAILLETAVRRNVDGMPPQDYLRLAEGATELDETQIDALLDEWAEARRTRGTAFMNRSIEHGAVGFDPRAGQLAESRQHQAAEVARLMNLPADAVDAPGGTGMTYANVESKRRDVVDVTLRPFIAAIEQRLTMGDVTPRGTSVVVDLSSYLRADTAAAIKAAAEGKAAGILTEQEARELVGLPPVSTEEGSPDA
jgi:hypothetical protein